MKIALVGNPNCGKTTLFNRITGNNLPVGNRAGVTVETTEGKFGKDFLYDLPGIYSLDSSINEENVSKNFLDDGADYIINVVDANFLSRSLLLTSQLLAKKIPMTVVLNMTDRKKGGGKNFDEKKLSSVLGCPVVKLKRNEKDFSSLIQLSDPSRYKLFYGDYSTRYAAFDSIEKSVVYLGNSQKISDSIDKILFNKFLAFPIFLIIMSGVLLLSSGFFGAFLGKYVNAGTAALSRFIKTSAEGRLAPFVVSLLADGIVTGVGGVLGFLPLVISLFFMLTVLEDCGYLSRVAVITDKIFSSAGVSGKMAVSLILGCGCTVPAVMSARTLEGEERKKCLANVHFIPCSAKLPVLSALVSCAFDKGYLFAPLFYLVGTGAVFISLYLTKSAEPVPFVMELPPLQKPNLPSVAGATGRKLRSFLGRACTVVFVSSVAVWFLINYDFSLRSCPPPDSILAVLCGILRFAFLPIGLADWRTTAAFIAGFAGKETVIGVLSVVGGGDISSIFTPFTAMQFSTFILFAPPCAASLATLKKELGKKDFFICLFRQFAIAYAVCALVNVGYLLFVR
ncbi:MAG: ferrous iron transporter B [Christensenellales bacterium]